MSFLRSYRVMRETEERDSQKKKEDEKTNVPEPEETGKPLNSKSIEPTETKKPSNSPEVEVIEELENFDIPSRQYGDLYCPVCDSHMNSDQMWESHIKGKRHLKNSRKGDTVENKFEYSSEEPLIQDELNKETRPIAGLEHLCETIRFNQPPLYQCFLCSASLNSSKFLMEHIMSVKHRMAFLKEHCKPEVSLLDSSALSKSSLEPILEDLIAKYEGEHGRGKMSVKKEKEKTGTIIYKTSGNAIDDKCSSSKSVKPSPPPKSSRFPPPPKSSRFSPPTSSRYSPPPTSSRYSPPPTSARYSPPSSSRYSPPPTSSRCSPPLTSSRYSPPQKSSRYSPPPTSSRYSPPKSSRHSPPRSSRHSPPRSSRHSPPRSSRYSLSPRSFRRSRSPSSSEESFPRSSKYSSTSRLTRPRERNSQSEWQKVSPVRDRSREITYPSTSRNLEKDNWQKIEPDRRKSYRESANSTFENYSMNGRNDNSDLRVMLEQRKSLGRPSTVSRDCTNMSLPSPAEKVKFMLHEKVLKIAGKNPETLLNPILLKLCKLDQESLEELQNFVIIANCIKSNVPPTESLEQFIENLIIICQMRKGSTLNASWSNSQLTQNIDDLIRHYKAQKKTTDNNYPGHLQSSGENNGPASSSYSQHHYPPNASTSNTEPSFNASWNQRQSTSSVPFQSFSHTPQSIPGLTLTEESTASPVMTQLTQRARDIFGHINMPSTSTNPYENNDYNQFNPRYKF